MKFLRDYDEVLDSTVMNILEQNFVDGIRASNQTTAVDHEPITVVPGNTSMFPHLTRTEIDETALTAPGIKFDNSKLIMDVIYEDWAAAGLADSVDKYITGISHYHKRMKSVISKGSSWANSGAVIIVDILESLFTRIESLRDPKATKQLKQRALVDLFKVLKDQGLSSMKWSVPSQIRESHQLLQLPTPSLDDAPLAIRESLEKGESYFHRCQVEISRIRSEISMLGSQYMSQREMALMQGYCEHMLFLICQERCMLVDMIETISAFESFLNCYEGVTDNIPTGQLDLSHQTAEFDASIALAIEGFRQLVLLLKESSSLVDTDHQNKVRDAITILAGCAQKLEEGYSPSGGTCPISLDRIYSIGNDMPILLDDSKRDLLSCVELCSDALPSSIFDSCIGNVDYSMMLANSVKLNDEAKLTSAANSKTTTTLQMISNLVQSTLISAQSICSSREAASKDSSPDQLQQENETKVCESHMKMINEWDGLQLSKLNQKIRELSKCLLSLHNNEAPTEPIRSLCTKAAINSFTLVRNVLQLSKCRLQDAAVFYRQHTKLLYVLLRVFRVLIAKGFCADDVSDGGEGDGAGGAGNMKFEDDVEGTGMGEGEGKNDVTDQIENEEQLLGLKGESQGWIIARELKY
jgi:midasin